MFFQPYVWLNREINALNHCFCNRITFIEDN